MTVDEHARLETVEAEPFTFDLIVTQGGHPDQPKSWSRRPVRTPLFPCPFDPPKVLGY